MTGAEITIKLLERQGIEVITGIPGGSNLPLYNALYGSSIRHVLARHEQGAGFIAQGMARATGKAAVCLVTSGPGVTNLISAIADAKMDSIPMVAIAGQIATTMKGSDAFQEVDSYGLALPITKHNYHVHTADELITILPEAFSIAEGGRPGPVMIDIPRDVQLDTVDVGLWPTPDTRPQPNACNPADISKIARMINRSQRPILYIGGGAVHSGASEAIHALASKNSIPVAATLRGLGCSPADDPLSLGMLGMHGAKHTNYLLADADLLIALGVRFDDRAVGNAAKFCERASIIHIDIDPSEINKIKQTDRFIAGDISSVLYELNPLVEQNARKHWQAAVASKKKNYPQNMPIKTDQFHPSRFISMLASKAQPDAIITTDVGQHQMWVAQYYPFRRPRTLLTSGGLGTMGFGLPAAIGAALACPDRQVICVSGDGSILMNLQELATLCDLGLNVKVIILNNKRLGMVRQLQEFFFDKRYIATEFKTNPDFTAIGRGFGIESYDLALADDAGELLDKALAANGPCILNVPVDSAENVLPIVPPGAPTHEMLGC